MGIHKRIKTSCPHCQQNIYKTIFWRFSTHLTLFGNRETLVVCSHCLYAYINPSLPFDKEMINCLLQSKNYQKLYASYKHRFEKNRELVEYYWFKRFINILTFKNDLNMSYYYIVILKIINHFI